MGQARRPFARLQIDIDHDFQRRMHFIQHVSWGLFALLILAALLGLFGSGPLSWASITQQGSPARLEYERFVRHGAPTTLQARLVGGSESGEPFRLWLAREYVRRVQVERITPDPLRSEFRHGGVELIFAAQPGLPYAEVAIQLKPERMGPLRGSVGLGDGQRRVFSQFVYP